MKVAKKIVEVGMYSVTRLDRIRNGYIRGSLKVINMAGRMIENRLTWFKRAERRRIMTISQENRLTKN